MSNIVMSKTQCGDAFCTFLRELLHYQGTYTPPGRKNALWGYIFGLNQYAVGITMSSYVCEDSLAAYGMLLNIV